MHATPTTHLLDLLNLLVGATDHVVGGVRHLGEGRRMRTWSASGLMHACNTWTGKRGMWSATPPTLEVQSDKSDLQQPRPDGALCTRAPFHVMCSRYPYTRSVCRCCHIGSVVWAVRTKSHPLAAAVAHLLHLHERHQRVHLGGQHQVQRVAVVAQGHAGAGVELVGGDVLGWRRWAAASKGQGKKSMGRGRDPTATAG